LLFQVVTSRSCEEDQPYQKLNPLNPCTVISPKSCPWICACKISWVPVNTMLNIKILRGKKGGFVSINTIDYHDIWTQTFIWIWSWLFMVQVWVLWGLQTPKLRLVKMTYINLGDNQKPKMVTKYNGDNIRRYR
jgi:hypothetical protein